MLGIIRNKNNTRNTTRLNWGFFLKNSMEVLTLGYITTNLPGHWIFKHPLRLKRSYDSFLRSLVRWFHFLVGVSSFGYLSTEWVLRYNAWNTKE